jgi:hypothetical protein
MLWNSFKVSFNVKVLDGAIFFQEIFFLFIKNTSLTYVLCWISWSFSGCMSNLTPSRRLAIPMVSCYTPFTWIQISLSAFSCFYFIVALFSLLVNSVFIIHFYKMSCGHKEATQVHALLAVYSLNNKCAVNNHRLWKWWSFATGCTYCLRSGLWTEDLVAKT